MRHRGVDEGLVVLAKLRGKSEQDLAVQREKDEILEAIRIESKEEGTWGDLFRSNGIQAHQRFYLALGVQFMQQLSGINIAGMRKANKLPGYVLCANTFQVQPQHVGTDGTSHGLPAPTMVHPRLLRHMVHNRPCRSSFPPRFDGHWNVPGASS